MTKSNDKHSDKDLKAYLDGSDGVSAAYRKTARDEPPAALDRAILDAARAEVVSKEPAFGGREIPHMYGPAALAASVMVAVLAGTLYFNPLEFVVPVQAPVAGQSAAFDRDPRTASVEQEQFRIEPLAPPVPLAPATEFVNRQLASAVPTVGAASTAAANLVQQVNAEAMARLAEPPVVVIDGPLLERIEADAAEAQTNELQEIVVTGSRVTRTDDRDYSYRASREDWLDEIRVLKDELDALSRLTGNTVFQEQQLQEEMDLFLEAYPDSDLDAELAE